MRKISSVICFPLVCAALLLLYFVKVPFYVQLLIILLTGAIPKYLAVGKGMSLFSRLPNIYRSLLTGLFLVHFFDIFDLLLRSLSLPVPATQGIVLYIVLVNCINAFIYILYNLSPELLRLKDPEEKAP
jgi:hypothetical protein